MKKTSIWLISIFAIFTICTASVDNLANASQNSNQTIPSHGTIVYPDSNSTYTNAIWMNINDMSQTALNRLEAGKITHIFLEVGEWKTDGTILYYCPDSSYQNFINTVKTKNPNAIVSARVFAVGGYQSLVDISTNSMRQKMINSAIACVNKGFDGFNEDLEGYTGSSQNLVDYWNGLAQAMHNINKIASVDAMCYWQYPVEQIYPQLQVDYICPMLYSDVTFGQSDFKAIMDRVLTQSNVPVLISGYPTVPLSNILNWIDQQLQASGDYSNLAGFSWWQYNEMTTADWDAWISWVNK